MLQFFGQTQGFGQVCACTAQTMPGHPYGGAGAGRFMADALEQFHFEIALATARADARREGVSAIYLRG